jgi:ankyrin repeat protein
MEAAIDEVEESSSVPDRLQEGHEFDAKAPNVINGESVANAANEGHLEEYVEDNEAVDDVAKFNVIHADSEEAEPSQRRPTFNEAEKGPESRVATPAGVRPVGTPPASVLARQGTMRSIRSPEGSQVTSAILIDQICSDLRAGRMKAHEAIRKGMLRGQLGINDVDHNFSSMIMSAVQGGLVEIVADLIFRGVDVNSTDSEQNTPLHAAYLFSHANMVEVLLSKGADHERSNLYGIRPEEMNMESIKALYFEACAADDVTYVIAGLGKSWVTVQDKHGPSEMTLLMCAAEKGYGKMVKSLVLKKADLNAQDAAGNTAAHHAFKNTHKDIGEYLVLKGTDSTLKNDEGRSVLEEQALMFQEMVKRGELSPDDVPVSHTMMSQQLANLKKIFDDFCTSGSKGLGTEAARTGRSKDAAVAVLGMDKERPEKRLGRHATMDLLEFLKCVAS